VFTGKYQHAAGAMIVAYGMHGRGKDALAVFNEMIKQGHKPDTITFISVLSACSPAGLVEDALTLYSTMATRFCVQQDIRGWLSYTRHLNCIVDALSRAGRMDIYSHFRGNTE